MTPTNPLQPSVIREDGQVFNRVLADVPGSKTELVRGHCEPPAPRGKTTVAVKITDMLGEDVFLTREICA